MIEIQSTIFFIDRCLGNKLIVETLRAAGVSVEIHDDHFGKTLKISIGFPKLAEEDGLF